MAAPGGAGAGAGAGGASGCFALASAADARADLAGRDRALATMVRNLGGSGQNIAVSTRWDEFAAGDGLVGATPQKLTSALDVTRLKVIAGGLDSVPVHRRSTGPADEEMTGVSRCAVTVPSPWEGRQDRPPECGRQKGRPQAC